MSEDWSHMQTKADEESQFDGMRMYTFILGLQLLILLFWDAHLIFQY